MAADFVTGLDLGTFLIKAVCLSRKGKAPRLLSVGAVSSPTPGLASEADIDLEAVAVAVRNLLASLKITSSQVVVSLPESKIFTRIISDFPFLSNEELSSAIRYSSEEFVPLPLDQVNLYWQVINRSKQQNNTTVFVVASPKNTVNKYLKILEMAKLKPIAIETDLIAATRVLVGSNQFAPATLIVQLGASATDFAVVSKGMLLLSRSIATGGMALTRAISQYLNFEPLQAEEYKKVYGLLEDQLEGKIYQVLKPLVDIILLEAQRAIAGYKTQYPHDPIKRVVLTGGGAKLPGLVIYLANSLGMEIQEADPWFTIEKEPALQSKISADAVHYTVAAGLALREQ